MTTNSPTTDRIEALLMALVSYAHAETTDLVEDRDRTSKMFKMLSGAGIKGSEIAQIFGVSEATVSNRLKS